MVNNDYYFAANPYNFAGYNQSKDVLNEWKEPGDITDIPAYGNVMQFDTHLLENASFLRLKNISLSYTCLKLVTANQSNTGSKNYGYST